MRAETAPPAGLPAPGQATQAHPGPAPAGAEGRGAPLDLALADAAATDRLGAALALALGPTDTLALWGQVGAGKSHLARALIRARLGAEEDVPSPTFTLVQTYGPGPAADAIWHVDLYRLGHPDEVRELGLDAALGRRLCLIEWPERIAADLPPDTLHLRLSPAGEGRAARLSGGAAGRLAVIAAAWEAGDAG
jgi:tRNA threonylcarbamoyladenosine biosynthesis protein TsaE